MIGPRPSRPRWRGWARELPDLQPKARSSAKDGETRVFCFAMESPEQRSGRRKRREDRHCEASGGAAGFRASPVLRGCVARAAHGKTQGFRSCTTNAARSRAPPTKRDVCACSRLEGKWLFVTVLAKARWGGLASLQKTGSTAGKLAEPVNALRSLEGSQRHTEVLKLLQALSSLKLRTACKAGRFLHELRVRTPTSQEPEQWQRQALRRRPPCGGRGCGCRASWPCRRDCR